jgi:hypothetical protein
VQTLVDCEPSRQLQKRDTSLRTRLLTDPPPQPQPTHPTPSIIYYPSEELEELDLDEIARDGHMILLPQGGLQ